MNKISFNLVFMALASLVLVSAFASAATFSFTKSNDITFNQNGTFRIQYNNASGSADVSFTKQSGFDVVISPSAITNLAANTQSSLVTVVPSTSALEALKLGRHVVTIKGTSNDGTEGTLDFAFDRGTCKFGPRGTNLSLNSVDINNEGEDDEEWKLLDTVKVEVDVENNGDDNVKDVVVELALFDDAGVNQVSDLDFLNSDKEEIELGTINDGDSETATFEFKVPADFEAGGYRLALKAYSDGKEDKDCADNSDDLDNGVYQSISLDNEDQEDRFVVVDEFQFPTEAICGDTVSGTFEVFNIGDDDQDQVQINVQNKELGLNQDFEIREDLDQGDSKVISLNFPVPTGLKDGTYTLSFRTYYDYRNGVYREESEETFRTPIRIFGCSGTGNGNSGSVDVDARLISSAKAGENLLVEATITNSGSDKVTLSLDAIGYQSWADLVSVSPRSLTLNAGESRTVTYTFGVNDDVSGSESFVIEADNAGSITTQQLEVNFPESQGTGSSGFSFGGSSLFWIIGAINVVLIVLIIVVAIRLSRR